jgi:hypothetical protein
MPLRHFRAAGAHPIPAHHLSGRKSTLGALQDLMTKIIIAALVAMLPACVAAAEQPRKPTAAPRPVRGNPCAAFGPGFVKVEGSSTCIKVGGSVSVEAGRSR